MDDRRKKCVTKRYDTGTYKRYGVMAVIPYLVFGFFVVTNYVAFGQNNIIGCPLGWEIHSSSCYQFVFSETRSYEEAASACWVQGSALVSVNDFAEFKFVSEYLNRYTQNNRYDWYTSGQLIGNYIKWYGDGSYSNDTRSTANAYIYWIPADDSANQNDRIIYRFDASQRKYGWAVVSGYDQMHYICEIPQKEVSRIVQQSRDFDFGLAGTDAANVPKGPSFVKDMDNVVVVGSDLPLIVDCVAVGNPQPSYEWSVHSMAGPNLQYQPISSATNTRYTFSNGRLTISSPKEAEDAGVYRCKAENNQGSIIAAPLSVSFGYLTGFSPNQQGFVQAKQSQGTFISCNPPNAKPDLFYTWYKDNIRDVIRPELNKYYFVSSNGNLYLSEVQQSDAGNYFCVVTLVPKVNERLSTSQPPSRTSRPIELRVTGNPNVDFGPIIHPDFIAVHPKPPLVGHDVRLECFAYGRLPLQYSWSREGGDFPPGTKFMYENRVMIIPNAQFDAGGNYTCTVQKLVGMRNTATKYILLQLEAKPYFVFPLRNMHADVGSELTWRCESRAVPRATYSWYKNSQLLQGIPNEVEIRENVLYIKRLDKSRDEGMYQCMATNPHGSTITSAQLRILSIKPSFARYPLPTSVASSEGGNLTIQCRPEAAPQPEITWSHNGQPISYGDGRREIFLDGTLRITGVTQSDQGTYTCKATNINGEDQSSTQVLVMSGIQFQTRPKDLNVKVNQTAFLYCEVSYDVRRYDLIYSWKFNGHTINTETSPYYRDGRREGINGLYIINAQYSNTGVYECVAETVSVPISAAAHVLVTGPPSEPAGVIVEQGSHDNGTVRLIWTWNPAADHGFPVRFFEIEAITEFSDQWQVLFTDIQESLTVLPGTDFKRFYDIKNLLPFNTYRFRVRAKNDLGVGPPSRPSDRFQVAAAAPVTAPVVTNTGGGAVGLLEIEWKALDKSEEGGYGFGYKVYWRPKSETQKDFKKAEIGDVTSYHVTVGVDNYYLPYTIKIQAYNEKGYGPIGPEATVFSAEGMPTIPPRNIQYNPINGTALTIYWDPVLNTREAVKGRVRGYRIDYIDANDAIHGQKGSMFVYGQRGEGDIIGLDPNGDYWIRVSVFNSAGISPQSERYLCSTNESPPGRFPQFVQILEHGEHSIRVQWRGVNLIQGEASLSGYQIMYWPVGDDIRTANVTNVGKVNETVVYGLQTDKIYKLRLMGVNRGGFGKKSSTLYFSILRGGAININRNNFDPSTSEIIMSSSTTKTTSHSIVTILSCVVLTILTLI
ncbi:hypothetical protein ACF0H5_006888 [Mactra antiquata]